MMPVRRSNQTWLPSIFNDFFDNDWMVKANATAPAINVIESDKDYKVEVAAPGMTKEDFKIHINEDNDLVISMEKKTEKEEKYMKELQDRYIRFDWAIKRLLRQKANFGVLEGFLTVFLGEQIRLRRYWRVRGTSRTLMINSIGWISRHKNTKEISSLSRSRIPASFIIWNVCSMAWRRPSPSIFIWGRTIPR